MLQSHSYRDRCDRLSVSISNPTNEQVSQAIGYSVELVCHVEAYPRPTITWVHQGIQLSSNQVYYKTDICFR